MHTVTALARQFGLSRSTLLYYHRVGLLVPSVRSEAGYRLYGEAERQRLAHICTLRRAGVPVDRIPAVLASAEASNAKGALARHLAELGERIQALRAQQARVAKLLLAPALLPGGPVLSRREFVDQLREAGLDEPEMERFHALFEQTHPAAHQAFLSGLGFSANDVARIRAASHAAQVAPEADVSVDGEEAGSQSSLRKAHSTVHSVK